MLFILLCIFVNNVWWSKYTDSVFVVTCIYSLLWVPGLDILACIKKEEAKEHAEYKISECQDKGEKGDLLFEVIGYRGKEKRDLGQHAHPYDPAVFLRIPRHEVIAETEHQHVSVECPQDEGRDPIGRNRFEEHFAHHFEKHHPVERCHEVVDCTYKKELLIFDFLDLIHKYTPEVIPAGLFPSFRPGLPQSLLKSTN